MGVVSVSVCLCSEEDARRATKVNRKRNLLDDIEKAMNGKCQNILAFLLFVMHMAFASVSKIRVLLDSPIRQRAEQNLKDTENGHIAVVTALKIERLEYSNFLLLNSYESYARARNKCHL